MIADEEKPQSHHEVDDDSVADDFAVEERFNEAHQGMMGMLFAAYKMRGRELRAAQSSLPLTIIGGFLGSGKTTLLNHLLLSQHGRKLVVLVNDFGRINIDASLVASQTDDMIKLSNGCACCAVAADLTNNLIEIAERDDLPDGIVLEASGIADPNGIVTTVLTNPAIRLDGNIVVVDGETLRALADDPLTRRLFNNQIAAADLVVLSKVDLMESSQRDEAHRWLADHYPDKRVIEAVNGNVPVELVLGIDTKRDLQIEAAPTDHVHDFESVSFTIDEPLDSDRLHAFLETLPESLLRAKGVLNLAEDPSRRTIYQRVGKRWSYTPAEPWGDETPHSSLVFIGPAGLLDPSKIETDLCACIAGKSDVSESMQRSSNPKIGTTEETMTFWTMLMIKVRGGDAKAAADAHIQRRSIEEAAESIAGFVHGETLLSVDQPDLFCVMCAWEDEAAYQQWQDSPLRAKQLQDLAGVIDADIKTRSFQSMHVVNKPQSSNS